jgi:hypothetical protein
MVFRRFNGDVRWNAYDGVRHRQCLLTGASIKVVVNRMNV